jgi:hypothetical protein
VQPIGLLNEANLQVFGDCAERTQFCRGEQHVLVTSVIKPNGGLEPIGSHPAFGAGDALVAINDHQAPKFAHVAAHNI